jgi:hypothetical protein
VLVKSWARVCRGEIGLNSSEKVGRWFALCAISLDQRKRLLSEARLRFNRRDPAFQFPIPDDEDAQSVQGIETLRYRVARRGCTPGVRNPVRLRRFSAAAGSAPIELATSSRACRTKAGSSEGNAAPLLERIFRKISM